MAESRVLRSFAPATVTAIRRLQAAAERTEEPTAGGLSDLTWRGIADSTSTQELGVLVDGADDVPLAYAHLSARRPADWTVEIVDRRGSDGDATALMLTALDVVASAGGGHVTTWADTVGGRPDRLVSAVAAAGLQAERTLVQLRVLLPVESPRWPDGVRMRTFEPGRDEQAWLTVNNRAFAEHPEQGGWTLDTLRARVSEPWFDPAGFLLAFADDELAGFCWTKVHPANPPDEPDALGEIYVIGVDPSHQGTGLGRALVAGGLELLAARGPHIGMLYVDAANDAAIGLYGAMGFEEHLRHVAFGIEVQAP